LRFGRKADADVSAMETFLFMGPLKAETEGICVCSKIATTCRRVIMRHIFVSVSYKLIAMQTRRREGTDRIGTVYNTAIIEDY
jgi:hypothetical protein